MLKKITELTPEERQRRAEARKEERRQVKEAITRAEFEQERAEAVYEAHPASLDRLVREVVQILRPLETDARTRLYDKYPEGHPLHLAMLHVHRNQEHFLCEEPQVGATRAGIEEGLRQKWPGISHEAIDGAIGEACRLNLIRVEQQRHYQAMDNREVTADVYRVVGGGAPETVPAAEAKASAHGAQISTGVCPPLTERIVSFLHDQPEQSIELAGLPALFRDPDLLTVADGHDLIEFGRRKHCEAGGKLLLETGWEWRHVTGAQKKSMTELLAENEREPAELQLLIRLTSKGRLQAAELRLQPSEKPNSPPGDRQSHEDSSAGTSAVDPSAYRPAIEILREHTPDTAGITTHKQLKAFLDTHPEIRTYKPRPQRLSIHIGDWLQCWKDRRADAGGWDNPSADELDHRKAEIRRQREGK